MSSEFTLRLAVPEDGDELLSVYRPHVAEGVASFEAEVPTNEAFRNRIATPPRRYPWIVAETSDERGEGQRILGYAYASRYRERAAYQWSVEVSVYVAASAKRRGVGKNLYAHLLPLLEAQGFRNAYAVITLPNDPSVALHEQLGFSPLCVYPGVGFKHGQWRDVGWWMKLLREDPHPTPPRLVDDCRSALAALGLMAPRG